MKGKLLTPGDSHLVIIVQIYRPNRQNRKPTHRLSRRLHAAPPALLWISLLPSPWRTTCTFLTPTMCLFSTEKATERERGWSCKIRDTIHIQGQLIPSDWTRNDPFSSWGAKLTSVTLTYTIQYTYFAWSAKHANKRSLLLLRIGEKSKLMLNAKPFILMLIINAVGSGLDANWIISTWSIFR